MERKTCAGEDGGEGKCEAPARCVARTGWKRGEERFRSARSFKSFERRDLRRRTLGQLRAKTPRHRFQLVPIRTVLARGFSDLAGKSLQLLILRGESENLFANQCWFGKRPFGSCFYGQHRIIMRLCGASVNHA